MIQQKMNVINTPTMMKKIFSGNSNGKTKHIIKYIDDVFVIS